MQRRWERHEDAYQGKKQGSEKRTKARQQSSQDLINKSRKKQTSAVRIQIPNYSARLVSNGKIGQTLRGKKPLFLTVVFLWALRFLPCQAKVHPCGKVLTI